MLIRNPAQTISSRCGGGASQTQSGALAHVQFVAPRRPRFAHSPPAIDPPAVNPLYFTFLVCAEMRSQSAANCQDDLILAFYIPARLFTAIAAHRAVSGLCFQTYHAPRFIKQSLSSRPEAHFPAFTRGVSPVRMIEPVFVP